MRVLNMALTIMLIGLGVLSLGDPASGPWFFVYGIAACFTLIGALVPSALTLKPITMMLSLTTAGAILGVVALWPDTAGWWRPENWQTDDAASQGVGMMIASLALFGPIVTSVRQGNLKRKAAARAKEEALERRTAATLAEARALEEATAAGPQPASNRW